jgi:hypothetical protein
MRGGWEDRPGEGSRAKSGEMGGMGALVEYRAL